MPELKVRLSRIIRDPLRERTRRQMIYRFKRKDLPQRHKDTKTKAKEFNGLVS
jgi:hypothetical protein